MDFDAFEEAFQVFLRGGSLFRPCLREDLERARRQAETAATPPVSLCRHGNRPLTCATCYFERDPNP